MRPDKRHSLERTARLRERVNRQLGDLSEAPRVRPLVPIARRLGRHDLIDRSAALTYYGLLGIIPAMVVLFSLLGLLSTDETIDDALRTIGAILPGRNDASSRQQFAAILQRDASSGALLGIGVLGVVWTASAFVGSFFRASATIWEVRRRPVWRAWPARVGLTVALLLLVVVAGAAIVVTGRVASSIGALLGLTQEAVALYEIAKWPAILLVLVALVGLLYRTSPSAPRVLTRWWLLTPGGVFAVAAWLLVSGGFTLYVHLLGSYDTAYGALGATVASMVWLWLTNLVLLAGVACDAELERRRARGAAEGAPASVA